MEQSTAAPEGLHPAMKPFALPLGLVSPLWLAYGAAASAGAAWWWMARVSRFVAPTLTPAPMAEPVEAILEAPLAAVEETAMAAPASVGEPPLERPDELTLIRGVGPRVADALIARGITTFAQLAAWSQDELTAFDAELKLLGRSNRYDFIGQARELAARVS